MKLSRLIRRDPARPTIAERPAALKDSLSRVVRRDQAGAAPSRRTVMGGALAAAVPLPVLAAPLALSPPHPDAELLALGARWFRAKAAQEAGLEAWGEAWRQVYPVLTTCPLDLFATREEKMRVLGGWRWPSLLGVNLRHVHSIGEPPPGCVTEAWTGEALRIAIARAVPMLGTGGQTPHRVRRWKALLPTADAFDARVEAVEAATDYRRLSADRRVNEDEFRAVNREITDYVAMTPEGMAVLVRVIGLYPWKDNGGAWPNLLRSAAHVAGIDPASLDHKHDSIANTRV